AEDGIRDFHVTGVQTCALPILHFGRQAPTEAAQQTLLHTLQILWWGIASEHYLLTGLMQMIKDGKQCILCFGRIGKNVNIIQQQYIYQLIKVDKITNLTVSGMLNKLVDKFFSTYIKYCFIRMHPAYLIANSLQQMRFTTSRAAKKH